MHAINRTFIKINQHLNFNSSNDYKCELHFNKNHFNEFDAFKLSFDKSYIRETSTIKLELVYLDSSKNIEDYEPVEYKQTFDINLSKESNSNHEEHSPSFNSKVESKYLWKLMFTLKPKTECSIYTSLSNA